MTDKPTITKPRMELTGTPELGQDILRQAAEKANKLSQEKVLGYASDLMRKAETAKKYSDALAKDLEAIENGQFTVTHTGFIVFDDPKRGQAASLGQNVAACPRCGKEI